MSISVLNRGGASRGLKTELHVTAPTGSIVTAANGNKVLTAEEKLVVIPVGEPKLPDAYQEVEYIESSGTQYIDTGWIPSSDGYFEIEFKYTSFFGNDKDWILGRYTDTSFLLGTQNGGSSVLSIWNRTSSYQHISSANAQANYKYKVSYDYETGEAIADGNVYNLTKIKTDSNPLYLFCADPSHNYNTKSRVYSLVFKRNGVLDRDFIPCYIKATGEAGLYDLVSETFFGNSGTGAFVVGEDVLYEDITESFGWDFVLPSIGTWTITSELGKESASMDVVVDVIGVYSVELAYQLVNYTMLYYYGDECEDVTGGFSNHWSYGTEGSTWIFTKNEDNIYSYGYYGSNMNWNGFGFGPINKLDLAGCTGVHALVDFQNTTGAAYGGGISAGNTCLYVGDSPTDIYRVNKAAISMVEALNRNSISIENYLLSLPIEGIVDGYVDVSTTGCNSWAKCYTKAMFLTKTDDWHSLAQKAGIDADSIDEILNKSSVLLSNPDTLRYMVLKCTGDFMLAAIQNTTFMSALSASANSSIVYENEHWAKFIAMVQ